MAKTKETKAVKPKKKINKLLLFVIALVVALAAVYGVISYGATAKSELIARQAVAYAAKGIKENPRKSNRGSYINTFNQTGGCAVGSPWCAGFVSQMIKNAGGDKRLYDCWTVGMKNKYKKYHKVLSFKSNASSLRRGDVLFRERPSGRGHVGIFVGNDWKQNSKRQWQKVLKVVEGNTSCSKSDTNGCLKTRLYWMDGSRADYSTSGAEEGSYLWESVLRY